MTQKTDKATSVLNDLIETCKDGQEGFRSASEGVSDSNLRTLFLQYSQQRAQFARQLQEEVLKLGGSPEKRGSVSAAAHRGWMNIKAAVTGKDDGAIVSECELGEDSAREAFRKALNEDLPANARSLVQQQYSQVKEAHDRLRSLEVKLTHR
jgi:uncharacterized protein (TIGR02284 family)